MRSLVNRDFREYSMHPDWLTLETSDLAKNNWKDFGSKSNYLDSNYSNKWRIIISINKQIITEDEAVSLLSESFRNYFTEIHDLLLDISIAHADDKKKHNQKDTIASFSSIFVSQGLKKFLSLTQPDVSDVQIIVFLISNPEFTYKIPFIHEQSIIQEHSQSNSWNSNSIQAFLRNNILIQVKRTELESEGYAIAIFIRKDLKLGKGKTGAQLSHRAISLLYQPLFKSTFLEEYKNNDQKTLLLYGVKDLKDLKEIEHLSLQNKINHSLIMDAGHTQIAPGTITVCAVGPLPIIWLKILAFNIEAIDLNS